MDQETIKFLIGLLGSPVISGLIVWYIIKNPELIRKNQEVKDNDQYSRIMKLEAKLEEKDKEDYQQTLEIQKISTSLSSIENKVFDDLKYLRQVNDQINHKFERYLVLNNDLNHLTTRVTSLEEKFDLLKDEFNKCQLRNS